MSFTDDIGSVMSYSVQRRNVISDNISNQVTPNYKAKVIGWNDSLEETMMNTTDKNHIPGNGSSSDFLITTDETTQVNSDGNNVDTNKELIEMLKNNQLYSVSLNALNKYYESMGAARGK